MTSYIKTGLYQVLEKKKRNFESVGYMILCKKQDFAKSLKKERNRRRGRPIYSSSPMHLRACEVCGEPTRWTRVTCIYIHTEGNLQQFPKIPT